MQGGLMSKDLEAWGKSKHWLYKVTLKTNFEFLKII